MVDGRPEPPRSALNYPSQPPQGDSSGPLFSIYSKIAEKEDDKMTDRWQKNADGILIFVSLCVAISNTMHINWNTADWFILYRSHRITRCVCPGHQAKSTRYLRVLSSEYLSDSRRPKRHRPTHPHPFPCRHANPILSS
jgi:hypothetical protein